MPHIIVRGIPVEKMQSISTPLLEELAEICGCGTDNFMIECLHTTSVFAGEIVPSYPFIEVAWFDREERIRDRFAEILAKHIMLLGIEEVETAFRVYKEDHYYLNGKRCFE